MSARSHSSPVRESRPDLVLAWRKERLVGAGFEPSFAARLAADREVDLHALLGLVDRGCPPPLAARIVAPLEVERRPC